MTLYQDKNLHSKGNKNDNSQRFPLFLIVGAFATAHRETEKPPANSRAANAVPARMRIKKNYGTPATAPARSTKTHGEARE